MKGWLTREQINEMGFASVGEDVLISEKACFYGTSKMRIGSHVRIDDFCVFVGNITLKDYVHIGAYCGLHASQGMITMEDFSGLSSNVTVYAASDDYSGKYLTNPTIPEKYICVHSCNLTLAKHSLVGAGGMLLPGAILEEGAVLGAMSLTKKCLKAWTINVGIPARKVGIREKDVLDLEEKLRSEQKSLTEE